MHTHGSILGPHSFHPISCSCERCVCLIFLTSPFTFRSSPSSLLSPCCSYCPSTSSSRMWWTNSLCTSAEDVGTLAENEPPTDPRHARVPKNDRKGTYVFSKGNFGKCLLFQKDFSHLRPELFEGIFPSVRVCASGAGGNDCPLLSLIACVSRCSIISNNKSLLSNTVQLSGTTWLFVVPNTLLFIKSQFSLKLNRIPVMLTHHLEGKQ